MAGGLLSVVYAATDVVTAADLERASRAITSVIQHFVPRERRAAAIEHWAGAMGLPPEAPVALPARHGDSNNNSGAGA